MLGDPALRIAGRGCGGQGCRRWHIVGDTYKMCDATQNLRDLLRQKPQLKISPDQFAAHQGRRKFVSLLPPSANIRGAADRLPRHGGQKLRRLQLPSQCRDIGIEEQVIDRNGPTLRRQKFHRRAPRQDIGCCARMARQDRGKAAITTDVPLLADQNALTLRSEMLQLDDIDSGRQPIEIAEEARRRAVQHNIIFQERRIRCAVGEEGEPGFAVAERATLITLRQFPQWSCGGEVARDPTRTHRSGIECGNNLEGQFQVQQLRGYGGAAVASAGEVDDKDLHAVRLGHGMTKDQRTRRRVLFAKLWEVVLRAPIDTKKYTIATPQQRINRVALRQEETTLPRPIMHSLVRRARNTHKIAIASPGDFVTTTSPPCDGVLLPYCLDFLRRRAIYICDADRAAVQAAPFYYLHLRQTARQLVSIPFERLGASSTPPQGDPVFLFSPGRVGSTLISRVLAEAGIVSVSEPDFYTQVASPLWRLPLNPFRHSAAEAMWHLSDDLARALGAQPVVKLRAECAAYPALFLRHPKAKTIVLLRDFESWSRSTAQVFGAGPAKAVRKYLTALRCYSVLAQSSDCHLMRYEDWVNDPQAAAAALGRFLGVTIGPDAVERAFGRHSQAGTPLIQRQKPGWQAKWQGALALWQSPRLRQARAELDVPRKGT